ncbi:hypothetical protein P7D22_20030 [Lichenihabitans sp. Uapishka_5]|uniref:hypothetical protein n=1 Tax=Lichenihabitans sp. Uapishka_5 TaxID=3037302 RepID=UPI0029E7F9E5|nr:hypothetical protein [Lichenihabitans sp. Uapishka_5]MDX7953458.1 hypothetical protein [Lichenihabitans sp. Uapishka_5]
MSHAEGMAADIAYGLEDDILTLEPALPAVIAMQIMLQTRGGVEDDATIAAGAEMGIAALALRGLLPLLSGEVAATARDLIANPERPMARSRLWQGTAQAITIA